MRFGSQFLVYTPISWLNDPATAYPVVIDPVVTTQASLTVAGITGTKYSAICWTNGCTYNMAVPTPPNSIITNVYASFEYFAGGACFAQDGGFSIDMGTCHFPSAAPGVITCPLPASPFNCGIIGTSAYSDFQSCLPAPTCAIQNLNFTLNFYRCNNDLSATCGSACVRASQPWIMVLEGRSLELSYISPVQQICSGDTVNVIGIPDYGIGPYTLSWSPGGFTSDTIVVYPTTSTTYTVSGTDLLYRADVT